MPDKELAAYLDGVRIGTVRQAESAGRWRRLRQEDLCQALGVAPAQKSDS